MAFIGEAHHDGSALYVEDQSPVIGSTVGLRVRAPEDGSVSRVYVRVVHDGEPSFVEAVQEGADNGDRWWRAEVTMDNPVTPYRFLVRYADGGYCWLNGTGLHDHEVTDGADFRLTAFAPPPAWSEDAVVYQVFLDRFATSGAKRRLPSWAVEADWYGTEVAFDGDMTARQVFGGDLEGVERRLDYIEDLGATVLYLTPFFTASSNHRYDARTFNSVDPLLGGNRALASLSAAAHRRGMRVLGDLTTNHTGEGHEWFETARAETSSTEHGFYYWQDAPPGYVSWLGHRSLPKLNYRSAALWARMFSDSGSVTSRWLEPPYCLDGWRVDVANMTGRWGIDDFNAEVARAMRAAMARVQPEALLVAEHGHDYAADVRGDGWHGVMNYAGFTKPAWAFLAHAGNRLQFLGQPVVIPRSRGGLVARAMSEFLAGVPWQVATHHFNLLGSHDTPRFLDVVPDRQAVEVGSALLFSFTGIPMVFAGDEIGLRGVNGEDSRRPFPWDRQASWDHGTRRTYRDLIALRRSSPALRKGGFRWVYQGDDSLAYLRESAEQRMLVLLNRASSSEVVLDAGRLGWREGAVNRYGGAMLQARGGKVTLPGDGPMAQVWELV